MTIWLRFFPSFLREPVFEEKRVEIWAKAEGKIRNIAGSISIKRLCCCCCWCNSKCWYNICSTLTHIKHTYLNQLPWVAKMLFQCRFGNNFFFASNIHFGEVWTMAFLSIKRNRSDFAFEWWRVETVVKKWESSPIERGFLQRKKILLRYTWPITINRKMFGGFLCKHKPLFSQPMILYSYFGVSPPLKVILHSFIYIIISCIHSFFILLLSKALHDVLRLFFYRSQDIPSQVLDVKTFFFFSNNHRFVSIESVLGPLELATGKCLFTIW